MPKFMTVDAFARLCGENGRELPVEVTRDVRLYRFATATADLTKITGRTIPYRFSSGAVARDGHTINPRGWQLQNFLANPQFLWAHDANQPPIGKVVEIGVNSEDWLAGGVEYIERDIYPFADVVFQMVKGGFLSAVSTSWLPIEWKFSQDKNRVGGIDFLKQELLEISQVPLPAQADALATARAAGIDTGPVVEWAERILDSGGIATVPRAQLEQWRREAKMPVSPKQRAEGADWKCGASRDFPVDSDAEWDGAAAKSAIFEACDFGGDKPDVERARKHFLVYDAKNPELKGSYKLPFATIEDGKSKAIASGIRNAASRLPQTDGLSDGVKEEARGVIDAYEEKMGDGKKDQAIRAKFGRDLYDVSQLAWLLMQLAWLEDSVEFEADIEQDGSDIPDRLTKLLNDAGSILVDMTKEEVAELLAVEAAEESGEAVVEVMSQAAKTKGQRMLLGLLTLSRDGNLAMPAYIRKMIGEEVGPVLQQMYGPAAKQRAGKVLSADNLDKMNRAMDHMKGASGIMQEIIDAAAPADDGGDDAARAAEDERLRRAKALQKRNQHAA